MTARRLVGAAMASVFLVLGPLAGVATAHISAYAPDAAQGGYTKITFRVPSEKDTATTVVELAMPSDAPVASVRVKPVPGWKYEVVESAPTGDTAASVVDRVVWTADGPGILPGEFAEFDITAGPLPETPTMTFKFLQTYADGGVVRWIEETPEGGDEPQYPAPTLALAAAVDGADEHGMTGSEDDSSPMTMDHTDSTATILAGVALSVGVLALGCGAFAVVRSRKN
ncbi:YcnI family copper-binding membrane protein [Rhodococcoides fascians]|uniref:YcnI family copper-binding membrane protein n=1 Tax=Rhodococcoides fascians TaxID=1828 RepID=UPI00050CE84F|nr:YcnI family protein [Rhodococcus fascians]